MPESTDTVYEFANFRLDPRERTLSRGDGPGDPGPPAPHVPSTGSAGLPGRRVAVSLTPKAFDTLLHLVRNPGRLILKEEFLGVVWPDTIVEEATLAQNVSALRRALGQPAEGDAFIQTVPKQGYRFVSPVRTASRGDAASAGEAAFRAPAAPDRPRRGRGLLLISGLVAVIAAAIMYRAMFRDRGDRAEPGAGAVARHVMIAVLPFANASGNPADDYIADGMMDDLISELGRLGANGLSVIARSSAMRYRGTTLDIATIGRQLGADYILTGEMREEGGNVRLDLEVARAKDQAHVWSTRIERSLDEVRSSQPRIARDVARAIRVELAPPVAAGDAGAPVSVEVHEAYLKGRYFWNKRTGENTLLARDYFRQAIAGDPNYAPAYAALAETYAGASRADQVKEAIPAVLKAIELDNRLPEAHTSAGIVALLDYDWEGARREFQAAVDLNPNSVPALIWQAQYLQAAGKTADAVAATRRALELDPLSALSHQSLGVALYYSRKYDEAVEQFRQTVELDPDFFWGRLRLAAAYGQVGEFDEAEREFSRASPNPMPIIEVRRAAVRALAGRKDEAREVMEKYADSAKEGGFDLAIIASCLGDRDHAFSFLERAFAGRQQDLVNLAAEPRFDPIRADPRFAGLLGRMGLNPG
jgi:TolB-like protein/DNA-binding winged helix-turn-helix (wHTH) protein/tetratricopeptide (TPR) repeat protein